MDQICHQFLHVFLVNLDVITVILNKFFQKTFVLCMGEVCKRFLHKLYVKHKREFLNCFVFRLLEKLFLPILTVKVCYLISIRLMLFNDFMKEEGP